MAAAGAWRTSSTVDLTDEGKADVLDDDVDDTVIRPRRGVAPTALPDVGDTVIRPRDPAAEDESAIADTIIRAPRAGVPGTAPSDSPRRGAPGTAGVSGTPVVPPMPVVAERRLAAIRFRDRVIPLDRPVVFGRRPVGPRIAHGPEPLMLTVPSPTGQVSGTHVTIRTEGTVVVVEDARSTNGTFVRVPGAPPLRMRAGAAMVVLTGTVVDIGDGNVIEILSPHLRVRPDAVGSRGPGAGTSDAGFPDAGSPSAGASGSGFPDAERPTP